MIEKEEHCIKERDVSIGCDTTFGQTSTTCAPQCVNTTLATAECVVSSPRLLDCWEVLDQKDKFKRKIEALDTAITEYIKNGGALINARTNIPESPPGCTTAYKRIDIRDPFAFDFGEDESIDWPRVAFANLQVQFNMKRFYFNSNIEPTLRIFPNAMFFLKFDEIDRRWYTKDRIEGSLLPSIGSSVVSFAELKSADTTGTGTFHLIPRPVANGDEQFVIIRLKHGLFIDLNLKNGDVFYTERSLAAMESSEDKLVTDFLNNYRDTLTKMALGEGQSLGFVNPILLRDKTPFPCAVEWTSAQMFEAAEDVQQCVKITVKTTLEYFFVMASNLADKSSWIYIHQTLTDLCLHKLDPTLERDEISVCAKRYGRMSSGSILGMSEQLFICMYNVGDLISLTISRPSYDRNQRTAAISVINYNLVQNSDRGEFLIPRYYAMGSGESSIRIEGIFMTELETLQCQLPYYAEEIGGTFRCKLHCSDECSHHGCKKPEDASECYTCKNAKLVIRDQTLPDKTMCVPTCTIGDLEKIDPDLKTTKVTLAEFFDPGMQGRQTVCVTCHHECEQGCNTGITDTDCLGKSTTKICKNVRILDDDGKIKCLETCPEGTYADQLPGSLIRECKPCNDGCKLCDGGAKASTYGDTCLECNANYLEAVISVSHVECIDYIAASCDINVSDCCPIGLQFRF